MLTDNNIKYLSFYECIDFKEELSQQEYVIIEAEFFDMELLDALVIPKFQQDTGLKFIGNNSDNYIVTDITIEDYDNDFL